MKHCETKYTFIQSNNCHTKIIKCTKYATSIHSNLKYNNYNITINK